MNLLNKKKSDGTLKSVRELDEELKVLLNAYRKENIILQDRIFDLTENVIKQKDEVIDSLKKSIDKLTEEKIFLKVESEKKKSWW